MEQTLLVCQDEKEKRTVFLFEKGKNDAPLKFKESTPQRVSIPCRLQLVFTAA